MKLLIMLGIMMLVIFLLVITSWQLHTENASNYSQSPQITTVTIPQGAEDPTSGKNYEPQYIRVMIGINNTVKWINDDTTLSSVFADNQTDPNFFDATHQQTSEKILNVLKQGESFEYTFTKAGYFGYHGEPHPWMRGWVTVLPPSG
jgi:plastocyanin